MRLLADRSLGFVVRNAVRPDNYRSLMRAPRRYEHPGDALRRYFLGSGDYPARIGVKTPVGIVRPTAWTKDDVFTVNEVFCRQDYAIGAGSVTVEDATEKAWQ